MRGGTAKRATGWICYWHLKDPATGKYRQHSKSGFATQSAAQDHLNGVLGKLSEGAWVPDSRITVAQLLTNHWLPARRARLRLATVAQYTTVARAWIVPQIGGVELRHLTPAVAAKMVAALEANGSTLGRGGLSPRSVAPTVTVLKAATQWAAAYLHFGAPGDGLRGADRTEPTVYQCDTLWVWRTESPEMSSMRWPAGSPPWSGRSRRWQS